MYFTAAWGRQLIIASIVGISRYQLKLLTVLNFVSRPSLCWWKLVLRVFKLAVFNQCYDNWAFNSFAPFTLAFLSNLTYFFHWSTLTLWKLANTTLKNRISARFGWHSQLVKIHVPNQQPLLGRDILIDLLKLSFITFFYRWILCRNRGIRWHFSPQSQVKGRRISSHFTVDLHWVSRSSLRWTSNNSLQVKSTHSCCHKYS